VNLPIHSSNQTNDSLRVLFESLCLDYRPTGSYCSGIDELLTDGLPTIHSEHHQSYAEVDRQARSVPFSLAQLWQSTSSQSV
jgi:hypothetical protein